MRRKNEKLRDTKFEAQMADIKKDLKRIEAKVNEYNGLNQLVYETEEKISVLETQIENVEHKLD